jgi:hypothetical protein
MAGVAPVDTRRSKLGPLATLSSGHFLLVLLGTSDFFLVGLPMDVSMALGWCDLAFPVTDVLTVLCGLVPRE